MVSGIPQIFWNFFGFAAISLTAGAIKKKKPAFLVPIVPLSFILTYQYDLGYGTLLERMKGEAEDILETEKSKLQLPRGMITFESIEKARKEQSKFFIDKWNLFSNQISKHRIVDLNHGFYNFLNAQDFDIVDFILKY